MPEIPEELLLELLPLLPVEEVFDDELDGVVEELEPLEAPFAPDDPAVGAKKLLLPPKPSAAA